MTNRSLCPPVLTGRAWRGLRITSLTSTVRKVTTESKPATRRRARITRQGQITVPKAIRDVLGARPGDEIEFVPRNDELLVRLRPRRSVLDFAGLASETASTRIPATAEALDVQIELGMTEAARNAVAGRRRGRSPSP
jgi:AbrB family looped-hinge helix DNA binding protein